MTFILNLSQMVTFLPDSITILSLSIIHTLDGNIPTTLTYGVYVSQLVHYSQTCSFYSDFTTSSSSKCWTINLNIFRLSSDFICYMLLVRNGIVKCKKKPASSIDEFVEKERELNYQINANILCLNSWKSQVLCIDTNSYIFTNKNNAIRSLSAGTTQYLSVNDSEWPFAQHFSSWIRRSIKDLNDLAHSENVSGSTSSRNPSLSEDCSSSWYVVVPWETICRGLSVDYIQIAS